MKRIAIFSSIMILLAFTANASAQTKSVRESINNDKITKVNVIGKSRVVWVHDNERYIDVTWFTNDVQQPDSYGISIDDNTLTFNDDQGLLRYELHLDSSTNLDISVDDNARFTWPNGSVNVSRKMGEMSWSGLINEMKGLIDELVTTYDSIATIGDNSSKMAEPYLKNKAKERKYSFSDRTNFDFHWGFNNWGDKWYNGLMKMEGPYNLRTSFSSFQLSENYAVMMTEHTKFSIGIGYESDVYKFTDNYVTMDANTGALTAQDQAGVDADSNVSGSHLGDWSSRFVTRYVTLPLEFEYRDKGVIRNFRIALGVIPGLSFNGKHTSLKHELEQRGRNYQDVQNDISKFVNPYKIDVRLTFKLKGFGVFLQVPTLPVFIDTDTKVYPIKIGFMI